VYLHIPALRYLLDPPTSGLARTTRLMCPSTAELGSTIRVCSATRAASSS
jgi:hypothetical protein